MDRHRAMEKSTERHIPGNLQASWVRDRIRRVEAINKIVIIFLKCVFHVCKIMIPFK